MMMFEVLTATIALMPLQASTLVSPNFMRPSVSVTASRPSHVRAKPVLSRTAMMCSSAAAPLAELLECDTAGTGTEQRLIFVGGKGGVGKTSSSSAIAVRLADAGLSTLIVSTDPAHSLSDALMQDVSGGSPVSVEGCAMLQAMEVETGAAVARFRAAVGGFRAADLGLGGVAEDVLSQLGLEEFADILDNTPPGLDELLALAETLAVVRGADTSDGAGGASAGVTRYDRVVFDTAPTGHTLRLLAFPDFIDNLLTKIIALKSRLGGALALLGGLMGGVDPAAKLDAAVVKLERWQQRVAELERLLTDPDTTDFVVVGIPSRLAVAECARLLSALAEQGALRATRASPIPACRRSAGMAWLACRLPGSFALSRFPWSVASWRGRHSSQPSDS